LEGFYLERVDFEELVTVGQPRVSEP
jgi:hypothetical protein